MPRGQCAVVCMPDNYLYAMGGTDGTNALRSVECFKEVNRLVVWHIIPLMNDRRNKPSATVVKDSVIVTGGWNQAGHISDDQGEANYVLSTEILDTRGNGQWTILTNRKDFFPVVSLLTCADGVLAVGGLKSYYGLLKCHNVLVKLYT